MMRSMMALCAAVLWPCATLSAPLDVGRNQDSVVALAEVATVRPPPIEKLRGIVESVDEGNDTIRIRLSPDRTEPFKVQDGLLFNAVRFGDPVEIAVQDISGARTIVGLAKE
ncbi:hypothetical protein MTX26_15295 [Bradyrhizobium sp. ISRA443]|uniref:hypothetical protein n=1 Tax=unclassified Bradyrhizobium TaxID=2631580 RepID=UPI00247A243D|nr:MULTISPECIES: hypothetical protein [unclassified Bradyrhizobium]WGS02096.1 hypothetical protein MTX23_15305 [Bradyrhizobium sp. ISRA436]WGS08981.1 hypothetical protein MTX18_15295 [Bradyrhizobium sp. ISRA437]WGS15870.1 hypothetical protein MTX26_15295 [Bradyrhizobium sp. ISRA443]